MSLLSCQTQYPWFQLRTGVRYMDVWLVTKLNLLGFNYVSSPSGHRCSKLLNLTFLGSATCQAQVDIGVTSCQSQYPWVHLRAKPKYKWIQQAVKPNILGFSYALSSSTYGSGELSNSTHLGSAIHIVHGLDIMPSLSSQGSDNHYKPHVRQ